MAEQGKKVEVRFGAFTCSIEGYDNPVEQMREILGMMQRMITETPALAETDPDFDASQIENAISDREDTAATQPAPGVVVIRNSSEDAAGDGASTPTDAEVEVTQEPVEENSESVTEAASETFARKESTVDLKETATDEPGLSTPGQATSESVAVVDEPPFEERSEAAEDPISSPTHRPSFARAGEDPMDEVSGDTDATAKTPEDPPLPREAASEGTETLRDEDPFTHLSQAREPAATGRDWLDRAVDIRRTEDEATAHAEDAEAAPVDVAAASDGAAPGEAAERAGDEATRSEAETATETSERRWDRDQPLAAAEALRRDEAPHERYATVPEPEPEPEPETTVANIFAAPKRIASAASTAFNLFASPNANTTETTQTRQSEPVSEVRGTQTAVRTSASGADNEASGFGAPYMARGAASEAEPSEDVIAEPHAEEVQLENEPARSDQPIMNVRSIFAAPSPAPEGTEARQDVEPAPQATVSAEAPAERPAKGRFRSLLSRLHGDAMVGAPTENSGNESSDTAQALPQIEPADLAERSNASSVADQLSAAAAWLTLAKGKSRMTRREVMEVLEKIPAEHPRALADRIKGFGKLVRSGSLILIDDGVFAMAQAERDRFQQLIDR